jgi:hypothetical protein
MEWTTMPVSPAEAVGKILAELDDVRKLFWLYTI